MSTFRRSHRWDHLERICCELWVPSVVAFYDRRQIVTKAWKEYLAAYLDEIYNIYGWAYKNRDDKDMVRDTLSALAPIARWMEKETGKLKQPNN